MSLIIIDSGEIYQSHRRRILTKSFLEKYVQMARKTQPRLSNAACRIIIDKYCDIRQQEAETMDEGNQAGPRSHRTQPVTVRTLETLLRLACAHAKARMHKNVDTKDAKDACQLVSFVLFREVVPAAKKGRKRAKAGVHGDDGDEDDDDQDGDDVMDVDEAVVKRPRMDAPGNDDAAPPGPIEAAEHVSQEDLGLVKRLVSRQFEVARVESLTVAAISEYVTMETGGAISPGMVLACLRIFHDDNLWFMLDDIEVYLL